MLRDITGHKFLRELLYSHTLYINIIDFIFENFSGGLTQSVYF
jgi:hypothetical protein